MYIFNHNVRSVANTSVLKWWYKDKGPILLKDDTLQVELNLEIDERLWNITIAGYSRYN